jgi:hypothetical protein
MKKLYNLFRLFSVHFSDIINIYLRCAFLKYYKYVGPPRARGALAWSGQWDDGFTPSRGVRCQ